MSEEYYGVYVCSASNEAGTTEVSVVIARSGKTVWQLMCAANPQHYMDHIN